MPYSKKKAIYEDLKKRSDWTTIEKTEKVLHRLFKNAYGKTTSVLYRMLHWNRNKEFIYGEIDFLAFFLLLEKVKPQTNEIFYDLGSGTGKATFTAGLFFDLSKSCGVELLPPLYQQAAQQLKKAIQWIQNGDIDKHFFKKIASMEFTNDNFLDYQFHDADIIYIAATCLNDDTWSKLVKKMTQLKAGCRIIVATREIQSPQFETIYQGIDLMSWGLCPVNIYRFLGKQDDLSA